jgi:hypothetical protein
MLNYLRSTFVIINQSVLHKSVVIFSVALVLLLVSVKVSQSSVRLSELQERKIVISEKLFPTGVIEIVNIYNPQSASFPKDFQIEVRNISKKPIYYLNFSGRLPNTKSISEGVGTGFQISYGDGRLITTRSLATSKDVPILPGKTGMMTIRDSHAQNLYNFLTKTGRFTELTSKVSLVPQFVNFGDGTGYQWNKPYGEAGKKDVSSNFWDECDTYPGGSCAKWQIGELTSGCNLAGCLVNYNSSNRGGEECSEVCQYYVMCTDELGQQNMCRSLDLFPCGLSCEIS